jgi:Asp-tRNA(Asn)/Glu-tRNA(Gln) amidotransferase A subunit family amidase
VRTGNGNRAFAQCYPPANHSADFIDVMIRQGAIIVGKTKTAEFAGEQEVVADWVDYSYPFNPRGDYYLGATGSSTGSAAAIATYPWLDITVGTDGEIFPSPQTCYCPKLAIANLNLGGGSVRDLQISC